jgi:hypothetical protein
MIMKFSTLFTTFLLTALMLIVASPQSNAQTGRGVLGLGVTYDGILTDTATTTAAAATIYHYVSDGGMSEDIAEMVKLKDDLGFQGWARTDSLSGTENGVVIWQYSLSNTRPGVNSTTWTDISSSGHTHTNTPGRSSWEDATFYAPWVRAKLSVTTATASLRFESGYSARKHVHRG